VIGLRLWEAGEYYFYGKRVEEGETFTDKQLGAFSKHRRKGTGVVCGRRRVKWATDNADRFIDCWHCRRGFPSP